MPMDEYTLADIFRAMELELITSMRQTLTQHEKWEEELGYSWEQWQISKLRAIQVFRTNNQAIVSNYNFDIQKTIDTILRQSYGEAYNNSIKLADEVYLDIAGMNNSVDLGLTEIPEENFFQINDQRLNSIINEMQSDFGYANNWILGLMDNRYRDILAKSVIKLNSGATSINAAIDEATEDFLKKGIDCVVYKDGKRVNIASYAEMYLRTSAQRARLVADGAVRSRMKVYTVASSQHLTACSICLKWQDEILIDDMYTDLKTQDALTMSKSLGYPLLSEAMKDSYLHPNCRHTLYTFFPGKSSIKKPLTKEQSLKALDKYNVEQKQRKLENEVRRWKRLEKGSVSEKNKVASSKMVKSYQNKLRKSIKENPNLRREYWRERLTGQNETSSLGSSSKSNASNITELIETIDVKDTDAYIKARESEIRNLDVEHVYAVDKTGKVYHGVGNDIGVDLQLPEYSGTTITHNHPIQSGEYVSFSESDYDYLKAHQNIKSLHAVNSEYLYTTEVLKQLDINYKDLMKEALDMMVYEFSDNDGDLQHYVFEILKRKGYVNYARIKFDPKTNS